MKIVCPIHRWAREAPARIAVQSGSRVMDYATLDEHIEALSQQLLVKGLTPGQRLTVTARGSLDALLLAWACLRAGIVFCPLDPALPMVLQASLTARLEAAAFCPLESTSGLPENVTILLLDTRQRARVEQDVLLDTEQFSNTIFTSGSSGAPKAVLHRLGNHLASAQGAATLMPLDADSAWLLSLPLFHVGGYAIPFRVFRAGARVVLDNRHSALAMRLERLPITHLSLVPTQLWRLLEAGFDPSTTRLRELLLGGAPIPAPLVARMTALGLPPKVSYGLSEMASQVCTGAPTRSGEVGKPLPGREVRLVAGEIQVRGETLFAGYLTPTGVDSARNTSGWFATRDRGELTDEGALIVHGRMDNAFISGGENIQPEAIEQRLVDHPGVAQALVVPVEHPEWGQRPVAFIDWRKAPIPNCQLAAWVREALPAYMTPDAWLSWPRQAVGLKPSRQRFAEIAAAQV
ncbi:o-succinylbenzoate--CoA ligase [Halomonas dongshanensis]|uniref:O-succinylbenzoate--CoA ligase n=1 Tax=Halomonas dongshanensis TaxID=2890835 RepID=A0ABT2EK96_9GAMM|nr:o-succinylbenzoate--CoA ligase [Halomonas dongshanensis]MCS2610999.1 o-succinylbenzoate--CoA ligase [Halomonas dongshanensis]